MIKFNFKKNIFVHLEEIRMVTEETLINNTIILCSFYKSLMDLLCKKYNLSKYFV
jgi:hypothetical protein